MFDYFELSINSYKKTTSVMTQSDGEIFLIILVMTDIIYEHFYHTPLLLPRRDKFFLDLDCFAALWPYNATWKHPMRKNFWLIVESAFIWTSFRIFHSCIMRRFQKTEEHTICKIRINKVCSKLVLGASHLSFLI